MMLLHHLLIYYKMEPVQLNFFTLQGSISPSCCILMGQEVLCTWRQDTRDAIRGIIPVFMSET